MAHDVFISHATDDKTIADSVCNALEAAGIGCWIAPRDIPDGADYDEAIVKGLDKSRVLVVVLSSHSNRSKYVKNEVAVAMSRKLRIVVLRTEDVVPSGGLELFLVTNQWINAFSGPLEPQLKRTAKAVKNPYFVGDSSPPRPERVRDVYWRNRVSIWIAICIALFLGLFVLQHQLDPETSPELVKRPSVSPWLFPDSHKKELSDMELGLLTRVELFWARNEIYARRGYKFCTPNGKAYAESLGKHYIGEVDHDMDIYARFNPIEKNNVHTIKPYEKLREISGAIFHPGNWEFFWHRLTR